MEEGFFENFKAISTDMDNINFQRFATVIDYNGDTYTVREDEDNDVKHSNVLLPSNLSCEVGDKVIIGFIDNSIYSPVIIGNLSRGILDDIHTDYYFTLDSFFDPNQWTGNPTINNGTITLVKDSSFPLRLPPNCALIFTIHLPPGKYDVGDKFEFTLLERSTSYTITEFDRYLRVDLPISITCTDNNGVIVSEGTGDEWIVHNISSLEGLNIKVKTGATVTISGVQYSNNNNDVDDELSSVSTNPVQNKVITNALNNLADVATSGSYDDLTDKPTIPSKTSDLTNDGDGTNVFIKDNDARLSDARTPLSHNHDDRYYNQLETDALLSIKQDNLVSGTNIKTINNESLLGSGNITIQGGGGSVTVDDSLSNVSENPVQNKVINAALGVKAPINHASTNSTYGLGNLTDYGHVKIINDLNSIGYENGLVLSAYQGAVLKALIDTKQDLIEDTGWKNITYNSGWTDYNNDNALRYRRVGKVVEVRGWVKPSSNQSGTTFNIATISDTTCRPSSSVNVYSKGFSNYHFQFAINSAGEIIINKFYNGTTSQSQATTSQVFLIQATYLVD